MPWPPMPHPPLKPREATPEVDQRLKGAVGTVERDPCISQGPPHTFIKESIGGQDIAAVRVVDASGIKWCNMVEQSTQSAGHSGV